ncbi:uncharacterized protein LOC141912441 [Tubulanus polymorphus]|uniref:uncharacterized protein LOC141912441 n=1 Tax=Tubulanus polymorphus TaxID=672921 RepID=UPI003DA2CCEE
MVSNQGLDMSDDQLGRGAAAPYGYSPASRSLIYPTPPSTHGQRIQWLPPQTHPAQQLSYPHPKHQQQQQKEHFHPSFTGQINYEVYSKQIYQGFRSKKVFGCAVCMILFGSIHILSGAIMAFYIGMTSESFGGYGIWGGIFFLSTGLFALLTYWCNNTCTVGFTFVLGVMSSVIAVVQFVLAILMCLKFYMAILDVFTLFSTIVTAIVLSVKCASCRLE